MRLSNGSTLGPSDGCDAAAHDEAPRVVSLKRPQARDGLTLRAKRLDLSLLPEGILADLLVYWQDKRDGERLPGRADIDPLDFSWALGRLCLIEVLRNPLVFRYRLDGSLIASHRRRDMTGRTTDEIKPLALANILRKQYSEVVKSAAPGYFEVDAARDKIKATFAVLALPLAADGAKVDMLLVCALNTEPMHALCLNLE
ncbi:MAG: PAS domain-containing protein [Kiloniellales bacterium]